MILKIKICDGAIVEIHIDPAEAPAAMDLVRVLIGNGVTAAKIIKPKPATGTPVINVAHNVKGN